VDSHRLPDRIHSRRQSATDDSAEAFNVISLFSGVGGIELGLRLAVPNARAVCFVEREAYCCEVLEARMDEALLAPALIWTDVTTFDGRPWRGVVDCVAGGFPCQDISDAGKRAGFDGARSGLWHEFARIVREVEPGYVFVENVAALANRGLDVVLGTLADLGYDAKWDVFTAAAVGAPHRRRRLFTLARAPWAKALVYPHGDGLQQQCTNKLRRTDAAGPGAGCYPPGPQDAWDSIPSHLKPAVRRVADGVPHRVDRLRALGNAVLPDVARMAFLALAQRLEAGNV